MILVTGISGFLGRYVAQQLLAKGYEVVGVSRHSNDHIPIGVDYQPLDLADQAAVAALFDRYDFKGVIHCAAKSSAWGTYQSFYSANVLATQHIVDACQKHGVDRLVHISSPSVYARLDHQLAVKETEPFSQPPLNHYIETKRKAEAIVKQSGLSYNILRPRALIGDGDTSVIPRLLQTEAKSGIPLLNQGQNLMDVTCIENAAYACLLALECESSGGVYNVTNGDPKPFIELMTLLFDHLGRSPRFKRLPYGLLINLARLMEKVYPASKEPPLTVYTLSTLAFSQTLDISALQNELGYRPLVTLEEKVGDYADWYRHFLS